MIHLIASSASIGTEAASKCTEVVLQYCWARLFGSKLELVQRPPLNVRGATVLQYC
jgi:hypothetical protein